MKNTIINTSDASKIRNTNPKNAMICYLNVNYLRNKVSDMKDVTDRLFPTVLGIGEIKLDTRIPNVPFCLDDYYNQGLL